MSGLAVTLPGGRVVPAGDYVAAWKTMKLLSPSSPVRGWNWYPVPAGEVLRALDSGLHDRINRHDRTQCACWRKLGADYQVRLSRDARRLLDMRQRRIRVYQFETDLMRARFSHLLSDRSEP